MSIAIRYGGLILIALLFTCDPAYAECPKSDARIFFINGILTPSPHDAINVLQEVLNRELTEPGDPTCDILVESATNRTMSFVADLCEAALQLRLINSTSDCLDALNSLFPDDPETAERLRGF